jgi:hypothetical protein
MLCFFLIVGWSSFLFPLVVHAEEEVLCTYGKLFLSDTSTSQIHVIDLNLVEPIGNLMVETTVTVEGGPGEIDLYSTANGKAIATLYGGSINVNYTDGVVNWIHTGIELENHGDHSDISFTTPSLLPNGALIVPKRYISNAIMVKLLYFVTDPSVVMSIPLFGSLMNRY